MRILFILLIAGFLSGSVADANQPIRTKPIHTKHRSFHIPFRYDTVEMRRINAKSVRLYVSYDHGKEWKLIQNVRPSAKKFVFTSKKDGEYWFAVRTVTVEGKLIPSQTIQDPGLKVIVDTKKPQMDFQIRQLEPGKVQLDWNISDDFIDIRTLQFEYRYSKTGKWTSLMPPHNPKGTISWLVSHGKDLHVKGTVSDLAKNEHSKEVLFKLTSAAGFVPKPRVPDFSQPIAKRKGKSIKSMPVMFPRNSLNEFAPRTDISNGKVSLKVGNRSNGSDATGKRNVEMQPRTTLLDPEWMRKLDAERRPHSAPSPIRNRNLRSHELKPAVEQGPSTRASFINSQKFEIKYRVDHVGSSGVSRVSLYITEDNGKKWYRYGSDPDRKSPFEVTLPRQGTYGFALRVTSRAGLGHSPPEQGEPPELSVTVDRTPPVIKSLVLKTVGEPIPHKVTVNWKTTDQRLATVPVSLYYAEKQNGPWVLIEDGVANTGHYEWDIRSLNLTKVFFRLKVRDLAGNETIKGNERPYYLDRSTPSVSILEVTTNR